jgi:hypothetical protein
VNRSLPRGDLRHRKSDPGGPSRSARTVPCSGGLVGGVAAAARNSHCCATVGPRSFGARIGEPSLAELLRYAGRSRGLRLIEKSRGGARLHVIKHGGFERRRANPALLEILAPLETLCALVLDQCS